MSSHKVPPFGCFLPAPLETTRGFAEGVPPSFGPTFRILEVSNMDRRFSRLLTALVLTSSLLATSITAFSKGQETGQTQAAKTQSQTSTQDSKKTPPPVPSKAPNAKPLSTNE